MPSLQIHPIVRRQIPPIDNGQILRHCPVLAAFLTTTCGAKIPPKLTPLRTLPAVDVLRGSEGALPNGCASVSFAAGVVGLAGLLAQEPRVVLEVWHKEK